MSTTPRRRSNACQVGLVVTAGVSGLATLRKVAKPGLHAHTGAEVEERVPSVPPVSSAGERPLPEPSRSRTMEGTASRQGTALTMGPRPFLEPATGKASQVLRPLVSRPTSLIKVFLPFALPGAEGA
jgi:hypothetical protein